MQTMLGLLKNRLTEAKREAEIFFFMRLLENYDIQNVNHELKEDLQTKIDQKCFVTQKHGNIKLSFQSCENV